MGNSSKVIEDPRNETSDIEELPEKTWFRNLDKAVIESDRCIKCGTCVAACPSDSIGIDDTSNHPTLVSMCTGCSRCWDFCPRGGLRYERLLDLVDTEIRETYAVRAKSEKISNSGQDGGAVTTILSELLSKEMIDGAIIATEDNEKPMKGKPFLATNKEELWKNAGSFYNQTIQLGHIEDLLEDISLDNPKLALVGTPCITEGTKALQKYKWKNELDTIKYTIGLMCTRNFEYNRLQAVLIYKGVDLNDVDKIDIREGTLYAYDKNKNILLEENINEFDDAALRGCIECSDFTSKGADISAGNIGSKEGYTTLIVRTEKGKRMLNNSIRKLESKPIDNKESISQMKKWNKKRAKENIPRDWNPNKNLNISYKGHLEKYEDSNRSIESINPVRVHQYEERC